MSTDAASGQSMGVVNFAHGTITSDGTAITVTVGFKARYIKFVNFTDRIVWEKLAEMSATQALKTVAAGTMTLDTNSGLVINTDGTFTVSAAAADTAKVCHWIAFA